MIPERLSFFSTQENHVWREIRGWLLPSAAEELYRQASQSNPNGIAVEIGSFSGKSTVCIARALIDNWQDNNTPNLVVIDVTFQADFKDNLTQFKVSDNLEIMECSSLSAADNWDKPISFIYIDGHHGKAHAYADLLVWDTFMIPGGIIALDDTAGFMLGPNLQLQAAIRTGAYELVADVGGVSFLKKKQSLLPFISDFPLAEGSVTAYLHYVSAWLGAMDPAFRSPAYPQRQHIAIWRRIGIRLLNTSPRQALHFFSKKLVSLIKVTMRSASIDNGDESVNVPDTLKETYRILQWLETECNSDKAAESTLSYLSACLDIRLNHIDNAIRRLEALSELDRSLNFAHYNISIQEFSVLRLAQSYDLQGATDMAAEKYQTLIKESIIPEILHQAEFSLSQPFQLPPVSNKLLLREYNLNLSRYKTIHDLA